MFESEVEPLQRLGLTATQAKIYLAVLRGQKTTAKTVSQNSGIAREAVYHTLPSLEALGIITKRLSTPTTYEAANPKDAISILLKKKRSEYEEILIKANQALKNLCNYDKSDDDQGQNDKTILVSKSYNLPIKELMQAMKKAKATVDFTTRFNLFLHAFNDIQLSEWIGEMNKAAKRGVKFRMLIEKTSDEKPVLECSFKIAQSNSFLKNPNFEFRCSPSVDCIIIVLDNESCLIETSQKHDIDISPYIWTNNPALVTLSKTYFEANWNMARNLPPF